MSFSLADNLPAIYPTLNAAGESDLVWWSADELYSYFDRAAKLLARNTGLFLSRDTSLSVQPNAPVYTLPAGHVSTVHVSVAGKSLESTNVLELEAGDSLWPEAVEPAASPNPRRWLEDADAPGSLRLSKIPGTTASGAIAVVMHRFPTVIAAGTPTVSGVPAVWRDYFSFYALGEARSKESKGAMPEVGQAYQQLAKSVLDLVKMYYGGAQ
jgi:hypothetical protein